MLWEEAALAPWASGDWGWWSEGRLHNPATNQCTFCCYRGLEAGVGQLQGFWYWPGTGVLLGMSLRLCKGMPPGHFFPYKTSPMSPVCPSLGRRESHLATLFSSD